MHPDLPRASETPSLFEEGHLWIQELVVGAPLRFRLEPSGRITFENRERRFHDDPPRSYRHAVRHVRERLDRDALLAEAEDPSEVVFYGVATRNEGVDYDWGRLPGLLGTDVRSGEEFVPPDVVERSFQRLGLEPVNAVEKEVQAAYFDPDGYEIPDSAWYDGPAAGVVIRNKRGDRAAIRNEAAVRAESEELDGDAEAVAEAVVTRERVERAIEGADAAGTDLDAVLDGVLESIWREEHGRLPDLDERAFRSAVVERVRERR